MLLLCCEFIVCIIFFQIYINYIQQCNIVQLCILRKLEAFCMPDVGGHVISREFSKDAQLYNMLAVCNFTARACLMLHSPLNRSSITTWHPFIPLIFIINYFTALTYLNDKYSNFFDGASKFGRSESHWIIVVNKFLKYWWNLYLSTM